MHTADPASLGGMDLDESNYPIRPGLQSQISIESNLFAQAAVTIGNRLERKRICTSAVLLTKQKLAEHITCPFPKY
jgi:hypothetical protein